MLALTLCSVSVAHAEQETLLGSIGVRKVDENSAPMPNVTFEVFVRPTLYHLFDDVQYHVVFIGPGGSHKGESFDSEAEANDFLYGRTPLAQEYLQYDWMHQDTDGYLMHEYGEKTTDSNG